MADVIRKCSYPTCEKYVNQPYDQDFCIYHASKKTKGLSVEAFNRLIAAQLRRKDFNFKGYIFPGEIIFPKGEEARFSQNAKFTRAQFLESAKFNNAYFTGYADFRGTQFFGSVDFRDACFERLAVFNKARFYKTAVFDRSLFNGDADFLFATFSSNLMFRDAKFCEDVNFDSAEFAKNVELNRAGFLKNSSFHSCKFNENVSIEKAVFGGSAEFHKTQFAADVIFKETEFLAPVNFNDAQFYGETHFVNLSIKDDIIFNRIKLQNNCIFKMSSPRFSSRPEKPRIVKFSNIIFNPDKTFFEDFNWHEKTSENDFNTIVIFRYCNLKNAVFFNNDLGLFSFFNSTFDQARFISNSWQNEKSTWLPFETRRNIMLDEILFTRLKDRTGSLKAHFEDTYQLLHLDSYGIIAGLYQRMKTALDNNKDYLDAGWFHFNELEMRRRMLKETIKRKRFSESFPERLHFYLLGAYRIFAGYGEKPLRSFTWFLFFAVFFFPLLHVLNGFTAKSGNLIQTLKIMNTDISFLVKSDYLQHFFYAVSFSFYRLIPIDYLPLSYVNLPEGPLGLFWSFLNTAVLLIMTALTIVGLKNHFRRF